MVKLFSDYEFNNAKSRSKLPLQCKQCGNEFYLPKNQIQAVLKGSSHMTAQFCSSDCSNKAKRRASELNCNQCGSKFYRSRNQIARCKNHFCSRSCSTVFTNKNKTYGIRRSKLEIWIESKLNKLYPKLQILYNDKKAIGSELDIYIPSLNLAFELNGIVHYKPIFGIKKLASIESNDRDKIDACFKHGITIHIINVSDFNYFKEHIANNFFSIIVAAISCAKISLNI